MSHRSEKMERRLRRTAPFITDYGRELSAVDTVTGAVIRIPRYGYWHWDSVKGKHQCVDVSADLDALRAAHDAHDAPVLPLTIQHH